VSARSATPSSSTAKTICMAAVTASMMSGHLTTETPRVVEGSGGSTAPCVWP
jgi:hypothetical protein